MKQQHINEIRAIIILAIGVILFASLISFVPEDLPWHTSQPNIPAKNLIRISGAYIAGSCLFVFGYSSYLLVLFLIFWSWNKFISRQFEFTLSKFVSFLVLFSVTSALFSLVGSEISTMRFQRSGIVGLLISDFLVQYFGRIGAFVILITLGTLTLILVAEVLVSPFLFKVSKGVKGLAYLVKDKWVQETKKLLKPVPQIKQLSQPPARLKKFFKKENKDRKKEPVPLSEKKEERPSPPSKPQIRITTPDKVETPVRKPKEASEGTYKLPPLDLLDDAPRVSSQQIKDDLVSGAKSLEQTLGQFGVSVRVADIERGPVITRYELEPAPGVKVQRITTLCDDIALAMKAPTVRIVAPIPGKNRVGIEVPNGASSNVYLKDVLSQAHFDPSKAKLMLSLGKDIAGKSMMADLSDMPHLMIAGTTGSGKTVCVNSLILSILFNASPEEVKFLLIDPKMVELAQYSALPHSLCPTVTDAKKASAALNWVVGEMESRYAMLSKEGVRNIKGYHAKGYELPYIVVIIDELADLMQVAAKTIESAITRLAQLSRAVGIHLILATQRPSVDVITGVIKANFPARISFKVASKVDSRTVLDMNGAENLIGKGDMLFIKPGDAKPTRGQCSFVSDTEIQRVIDFIKTQQNPEYDDTIIKHQKRGVTADNQQSDELYDEAVRLIIETNQASVSILQRRMRLGYTRAARLIDMMEQNGIVGPYVGSKPREILVNREEWLMSNMKQDEDKEDEEDEA